MKTKRFSSKTFTLLIALLAVGAGAAKPNVVLILADDLGYGDLSCYGQEAYQTPAIDQLAADGARATDYYVPVPYCSPSRAALLTGRFPTRTGMTRNPHPDTTPEADVVGLPAEEITLGEVFQGAGYKTSIIGKWHLGHKERFYPTRHGFDSYYGLLYSNEMLPIQIMLNEEVFEKPVDQRTLTTKYTERAIEFIEENAGGPFFLYLAHSMPHIPLAVSDKYYTPETPDDLYHDVIRELDWSVGEVMKVLEAKGILENTIVIFTSDNGPHYGGSTGGFKGKKATSWEGGTRVPFIIRNPSMFPKSETIETPIWSLDLFPTLLRLCGLDAPKGVALDGEDITKILRGESTAHAPIFSCHNEKIITIRDGDWKLFVTKPLYLSARDLNPDWVDPKAPNGTNIIAQAEQATPMDYPGIVPEEFDNHNPLFNLDQDPSEMVDLTKSHPEVVSSLRKKRDQFESNLQEKK